MTFRALVVDDDLEFARALSVSLAPFDWDVDVVTTVEAARIRLEERSYDVALVDGLLPDGDGRELIAWMRARELNVQPVYLSAYFRDLATVRSLHDELGVQVVLPKPVDLVELRLRLAGMVEPLGEIPADWKEQSDTRFEDAFANIRRSYAEKLKGQLDSLASGLRNVREGRDSEEDTRGLAHRLHGTAGTYGFQEASRVAGRIEVALSGPTAEGGPDLEQLDSFALELRSLQQSLEELEPVSPTAETSLPESTLGRVSPGEVVQHVLMVDPNAERRHKLVQVASNRLLSLSIAASEAEALRIARKVPLSCALVALDLEGEDEPFRLVRRLRSLPGNWKLQVAVISPEDEVPLRLASANASTDLFLVRPLSPSRFLEAVRRLHLPSSQPERVLLLEDDPAFAKVAARCLEARGMEVHLLTDPTRCLEVLEEVQPDLVLLDIVMPVLSGFDVCRLIRASPRWGELPVIMVTARLGPEVRIASFHAGADDYVAKPIVEPELVARVSQRVSRARRLHAQRERDSLTDLFLRRAFAERVAERLATARRTGGTMSLALIDLDHFKSVNDTHGHLAGDQVLAVLAQLVVQRIRKDDICARWGGEEFAIAFVNTDADEACTALDRIRETFNQMRFPSPNGPDFQASFSAGIADSPGGASSIDELLARADRLLYQAKDQGRNQVCA